jgi:hypothetical protein
VNLFSAQAGIYVISGKLVFRIFISLQTISVNYIIYNNLFFLVTFIYIKNMPTIETGNSINHQETTPQRRERKLKEFRGADIFVPQADESTYFQKHRMDVRRLPNGAILGGVTRIADDRSFSNFEASVLNSS